MNIPECNEFVIKHKPICCGKKTDVSVRSLTNHYQYFICRVCDKDIKIQYWPLYEKDIRDIKLRSIVCD